SPDAVYLDNIAAAQYPKSLLERFQADLTMNVYSNPHSGSQSSQHTTEIITDVRHRILRHFNSSADEYSVIFTAGATAALKIVAESFDWKLGACFCYLQNSHTSVVGVREVAVKYDVRPVCINEQELVGKEVNQDWLNKRTGLTLGDSSYDVLGPNLFAYPAMCNFSGKKFPLSWVGSIQNSSLPGQDGRNSWYVLLDASSHVSTSPLDLQVCPADFIPVSFYKIFGFPTGLGALLVRNKSGNVLKKVYYGGGTALATISSERFHVLKKGIDERFEDGTLPYLDIIALRHAFDVLGQMTGSMSAVSDHTFSLARYVFQELVQLKHENGTPVFQMYCGTDFSSEQTQGPVINFNVVRANGECVGYTKVGQLANLSNIHLRTGCFCNTGACQYYLKLSNDKVKSHFQAGHVCGDQFDLIDGQPTGSVRISFGYMSNFSDAWKFVQFLKKCFVEKQAFPSLESCVCEENMREVKGAMDDGAVKKKLNDNLQDDSRKDVFHLEQICLYPVKSCAAYKVSNWRIGPRGLKYDRQWMVITESGACVSQKREPKLCLIKPSIDQESGLLLLDAPGMPTLQVPLCQKGSELIRQSKVNICGDRVESDDCGDEAANWLRDYFKKSYRLAQQKSDDCRGSKGDGKQLLSLANTSQYLLISRASALEIHRQMMTCNVERSEVLAVDNILDRFRANLVISGEKPFDEDSWQFMKIGQEHFEFQSVCTRCRMVGNDQETGRTMTEPLKTLGRLRGTKVKYNDQP
ncbi:predicted protein, partial [Nematostella vectensis]